MSVRREPLSMQSLIGFGVTLAGLLFTAGAGWYRLAQAEAHYTGLAQHFQTHDAQPAHRESGAQLTEMQDRLRTIEVKMDLYGRNQAAICQAVGAQCR